MARITGLRTHGGAIRDLAERWLERLGSPKDGDFVCSPAGLWLALAAIASGARGRTADELAQLLGVAGAPAGAAVTDAAAALAATDSLATATQVWSTVPLREDFRAALPDIGFSTTLDPARINAWVREATDGAIERLPAPIDPSTVLALVNALVLTARWATPFHAARTRPCTFRDARGQLHTVPTMHRELRREEAWTVEGSYVVELACALVHGGEPARIRLVLGAEGRSAADVLPAAWAREAETTPVAGDQLLLALPRFALRTTHDVTKDLAALGVHEATSSTADFSALSPEPLMISQVVQESIVEAAELGVRAAAVTAVLMARSAAPRPTREIVTIAFDRPFGIAVMDGSGEVPLFAGWQSGAPKGPEGSPSEGP
ncbi:serpin family protein [Streptomyces sp. NPDC005953]|uniref:serpin family protein n=1 Tax=Streptomyces sp. NPDC005953 TaxID=3156719 RepID=UPI003406050C